MAVGSCHHPWRNHESRRSLHRAWIREETVTRRFRGEEVRVDPEEDHPWVRPSGRRALSLVPYLAAGLRDDLPWNPKVDPERIPLRAEGRSSAVRSRSRGKACREGSSRTRRLSWGNRVDHPCREGRIPCQPSSRSSSASSGALCCACFETTPEKKG